MRKTLKILRKILFWIFFVSLFFVTVITIILTVYEDDIKQFAIDELNDHLKTKVDVEDIELSIFHDFPYASIEFQNVFIPDAFENLNSTDTLLFAESMFFNFNIWDIYSGNYKVKRVSVHEATLQMKVDDKGNTNYDIIEEKKDSVDKDSQFNFLLELLELENVHYRYANFASNQLYDLEIHQGLLQGNFSQNDYELTAQADLIINQLKSNTVSLVNHKEAELDLELDVSTIAKSYSFNKGDLVIEKMPFQITGFIDSIEMDFDIQGKEIQIQDMANGMLEESMAEVKNYDGEGVLDFKVKIKGPRSSVQMPSVIADFSIENGSIIEPESHLAINEINLNGRYQNKQDDRNEELSFETFDLKLLQSYFSGEATITDFAQPIMKTNMEGDLNLERFQQFFSFKSIEKLTGKVNFNFEGVIQFFDPEYRKEKFKVLKSNGRFKFNQVAYKAVDSDLIYKNISGDVILNNKDAATQNLKIETAQSDILLNGALKNFIPFIEGSGNLGLIASVESTKLVLDEFLGEPNKNKTGPLQMFVLPANLNLNVDLKMASFAWENHQFHDIKTKVLMSSRKINLSNLSFKMLEGSAYGNLALNNLLENGNVIDGNLNYKNINVKTLFAEWDNFDQKSITDQHISGKSSGNIEFILGFNPYFSLIEEKLFANCDINIVNGELNNLETMKAITDYMRSNKALKLMLNKHIDKFEEKLLHLKFSDIENKLTIKDRRLTIPKMKIVTNALDVELFGWHDFDNQIEYHFSFRFRELKTKAEETEFGTIEDDGLGMVIYVTMFGDLDDPSFSLDKDERRANLKENIENEKQDLKSVLKTELGFFKKDSTVKRIEKDNKKEVEFIYFDEDNSDDPDTTETEEKNKKRTFKIFDKWKEEQNANKGKIDIEKDK